MAKKKIETLENAEGEIDITPRPNIRLKEGMRPLMPGALSGAGEGIVPPDEATQLAGWFTPNAQQLKSMWRKRFDLITYDRNGIEIINDCQNC